MLKKLFDKMLLRFGYRIEKIENDPAEFYEWFLLALDNECQTMGEVKAYIKNIIGFTPSNFHLQMRSTKQNLIDEEMIIVHANGNMNSLMSKLSELFSKAVSEGNTTVEEVAYYIQQDQGVSISHKQLREFGIAMGHNGMISFDKTGNVLSFSISDDKL